MTTRLLSVCGLSLLLLSSITARAGAQTVAAGPYYAVPSWDQTLPCTALESCPRFIVLSNMGSQAVLDRETGLVWQRTPILTLNTDNRASALFNCSVAVTGNRQGWRLPRTDELMSLADASNIQPIVPHLPPGHPFIGFTNESFSFWAADTVSNGLASFGVVVFFSAGANFPGAGLISVIPAATGFNWAGAKAWCVRGPAGSL